MDTVLHSTVVLENRKTRTITKSKIWETLEFNRFGVIAFVLAIVACTSGITAGLFVDGTSQFDLTMVATPTMLTLCSILIVAPVRWIIGIGIFAMLIDLFIILF
jgi:hypothetical protein